MTRGDLESASRGLELQLKTDPEIRELINAHDEIDMSASEVLEEACERELGTHWIRARGPFLPPGL